MKSLKSQPTSYKDFLQQIDKVKSKKTQVVYKIKQTPKNNNSTSSLHCQSTSLWDKRSPSHSGKQTRLMTEVSAQKRVKTQNQSHNQSHNQSTQMQGRANSSTSNLSKKDKMLSYHKFITQSTQILTSLFNIPLPDLLSSRISYIEYLQALKSLKLIYDNYEPYPNDLVSELWTEYISGQNVGNFVITVSAILGLGQGNTTEVDKYIKNKYEALRYTRMQLNKGGFNKDKQSQYTFMPQISERSRKIAESTSKSKRKNKNKKQNKQNRANKQNKQTNWNQPKRSPLQSIQTDHPLTDRITGSASKASIDYDEDYCLYTNSVTEPVTMRAVLGIATNTYNNTPSSNMARNQYAGNKRSQLLYERAKQKSCQKRENKSSNDIEFERSRNELTFKPAILKVKNRSKQKVNINSKCTVKGQKNTISRMIRGRVQRQVRRIINEKGVPYNERIVQKMRKQKYQQITICTNFDSIQETPVSLGEPAITPINRLQRGKQSVPDVAPFPSSNSLPLSSFSSSTRSSVIPEQDLIIDVYLSQDHKQKLMIKKGENLEEVATRFIQEHCISLDKKDQLLQMLQVSIRHALCPIDELVEEEDELASARTNKKLDSRDSHFC